MNEPWRIVVGLDGSDDAHRALVWATALASELAAEVIGVHGVGLLEHEAEVRDPVHHGRDVIVRAFEQWFAEAADAPAHRVLVLDGNPVVTLLSVADAEQARLIVVGSRGAGGFPGLQLGSTSQQLVQHAMRPVVVVPRPDGRASST